MLLCLSQDELATMAEVGVATIRRYEAERDFAPLQVEMPRGLVEAAGGILLGGNVGGRRIGDGAAWVAEDDLPEATRRRMGTRVIEVAAVGTRRSGRPAKARAMSSRGGAARQEGQGGRLDQEGARGGGHPASEPVTPGDEDPATAA